MNVLIVDDSRAMRQIVRKTLTQAGFGDVHVTEAVNGRDALAKISEHAPDLILSDWDMPEMDGMGLLRTLRSNAVEISFGFVAAQGSPDMPRKARDAGASFLISKPFSSATFETVLGTLLR